MAASSRMNQNLDVIDSLTIGADQAFLGTPIFQIRYYHRVNWEQCPEALMEIRRFVGAHRYQPDFNEGDCVPIIDILNIRSEVYPKDVQDLLVKLLMEKMRVVTKELDWLDVNWDGEYSEVAGHDNNATTPPLASGPPNPPLLPAFQSQRFPETAKQVRTESPPPGAPHRALFHPTSMIAAALENAIRLTPELRSYLRFKHQFAQQNSRRVADRLTQMQNSFWTGFKVRYSPTGMTPELLAYIAQHEREVLHVERDAIEASEEEWRRLRELNEMDALMKFLAEGRRGGLSRTEGVYA
ncbi:hypothetical protein H2199_008994 [Coniosporium tulheliwenetii]|uniref:Uncharacterized protein n=1 Tax=Coniosporium tulheliwenetii TaxID=3383036 RepID=A0ACC2YGT0_9PEZI|nr:hypothetical protein H2199_008994 [Cladosporium sp. JES 115]